MQSENEIGSRWFLILLLIFILGCAMSFRVGVQSGLSRSRLMDSATVAPEFSCDVPPPDARQQACDVIFDQVSDALSEEATVEADERHEATSDTSRY